MRNNGERERENQTACLHINHLTQSGRESNTQGWPATLQPQHTHKLVFVTQRDIALTYIYCLPYHNSHMPNLSHIPNLTKNLKASSLYNLMVQHGGSGDQFFFQMGGEFPFSSTTTHTQCQCYNEFLPPNINPHFFLLSFLSLSLPFYSLFD